MARSTLLKLLRRFPTDPTGAPIGELVIDTERADRSCRTNSHCSNPFRAPVVFAAAFTNVRYGWVPPKRSPDRSVRLATLRALEQTGSLRPTLVI